MISNSIFPRRDKRTRRKVETICKKGRGTNHGEGKKEGRCRLLRAGVRFMGCNDSGSGGEGDVLRGLSSSRCYLNWRLPGVLRFRTHATRN